MDDAAGTPTPEPITLDVDPVRNDAYVAAIVEAWFVETFGGLGLDVVSINRFREATERLKARLVSAPVKE